MSYSCIMYYFFYKLTWIIIFIYIHAEKFTNKNEITEIEKSVEVCGTNNSDEKFAIDNTNVTVGTKVCLSDNNDTSIKSLVY